MVNWFDVCIVILIGVFLNLEPFCPSQFQNLCLLIRITIANQNFIHTENGVQWNLGNQTWPEG